MKQLDLTKPVQQQNGEAVEIVCTTADCWDGGVHFPVIGIAGKSTPRSYMADGRRFSDGTPSPFDLINTPIKRRVTGWINVFPTGEVAFWPERRLCDVYIDHDPSDRIACIPIDIEYTEGDGLDGAK